MPAPKRVLRGVQNIRTMSGRVDANAITYKAYMKLSVLEMEKYRRGKEKTSALEKLKLIDERFQEIEIEKQQTLEQLAAQGIPRPHPRSAVARGSAPSSAPRSSTGPFKIRY
jgi:hypothetical protein